MKEYVNQWRWLPSRPSAPPGVSAPADRLVPLTAARCHGMAPLDPTYCYHPLARCRATSKHSAVISYILSSSHTSASGPMFTAPREDNGINFAKVGLGTILLILLIAYMLGLFR